MENNFEQILGLQPIQIIHENEPETVIENTASGINENKQVASSSKAKIEAVIKQSSNQFLKLTTSHLIWEKASTIIVLPVEDISFIGYKKDTNILKIIFGVLLCLIGLMLFGAGRNNDMALFSLVSILAGIGLIATAITRFIVFATSGGELPVLTNEIGNLKEWINAVLTQKENLKQI